VLSYLGGYNYFGTEQMYSGVDGRVMKASIFFGIVHYQRLRHMVSDKWQVIILQNSILFKNKILYQFYVRYEVLVQLMLLQNNL